LTRDGDWATLTVRVNGRGFDVVEALAGGMPRSGFGLVAIRERIRLLHGTFVVEAVDAPESGTLLTATAPYESHVGESAAARTASIGYSSAPSRAISQNGQCEP
jgi:signal transduction histidine kinase